LAAKLIAKKPAWRKRRQARIFRVREGAADARFLRRRRSFHEFAKAVIASVTAAAAANIESIAGRAFMLVSSMLRSVPLSLIQSAKSHSGLAGNYPDETVDPPRQNP
jgi:hypothetical protein